MEDLRDGGRESHVFGPAADSRKILRLCSNIDKLTWMSRKNQIRILEAFKIGIFQRRTLSRNWSEPNANDAIVFLLRPAG